MPLPIVTAHMFGRARFFSLQSWGPLFILIQRSRWQRGIRFKRALRLPAKDPLGLLQVDRGIVLYCWWLLWCDRVWLLHTWGTWGMVGISKAIMQKVQSRRGEKRIDDLLCIRVLGQDLKCNPVTLQALEFLWMKHTSWCKCPFEFIWLVTESVSRQVRHCIHDRSSHVCKYSLKFI